MLNVVQYITAEEAVGEKEFLEARRNVRARLARIANGESNDSFASFDVPENEKAEQQAQLPPGEKLLPPAPPVMIPMDGPNPFPGLDPPVG